MRLQAKLDDARPHPLYAGLPVTHAVPVRRRRARCRPRALGATPELVPFLGGSDLRHYAAAGIPAVHVGPGDLLDAHGYDESVEAAEVVAAAAFVGSWCA
jgi:acetylornithine deacetylase